MARYISAHTTHTDEAGVCVCVIRHSEETVRGLGGGSGIAKVNLALSVIYWHITRLTQLVRARRQRRCDCARTSSPARARVSAPYWMVQSLFFWLSAAPLLSVLRFLPSIPPFLLFSSLFGQFNHGAERPRGPPPSFFITPLHSPGRDIVL